MYINTPGGEGYGVPCERDKVLLNEDILDEKISVDEARKFYCYNDDSEK